MNSLQRIRFEKSGKAKYISHLDLMRTMQRVFIRSGIQIKHTEGFNPRPYMNFALPLSVGMESVCELMDFQLVADTPLAQIPQKLNETVPAGITVLEAYEAERKFKEIVWLAVKGELYYDNRETEGIAEKIEKIFQAESLVITKRSKKGTADFDVVPCIHALTACPAENEKKIILSATITAQNPALNPVYLIAAIENAAPELKPDFAKFTRFEVYDKEMQVFR